MADMPPWLQQMLATSGQQPAQGSYGRFGGNGTPVGSPSGGGLLGGAGNSPSVGYTPYAGPPIPTSTNGPANTTPGLSSIYSQMGAAGMHITPQTMQQVRAAQVNPGPSVQQFAQTFNGLPTDAARYSYWRSMPNQGKYDAFTSSLPGFGQWVNNMDYNGQVGGVGLNQTKWDPLANAIRGPSGLLGV